MAHEAFANLQYIYNLLFIVKIEIFFILYGIH